VSDPAVLRPGDTGEAVRDLQRRLLALGHPVPLEELGRFGPATERELRVFQERRSLRIDGICGRETWNALVESGFRLGDRMLYVRRPMLRGDDVAELQRRLNTLGFDAGKEDGIFGPDTADALTEFQRNAGLGCDGIFGPDTADALARIGELRIGTLAEGSVASVREREELRRGPHRIEGRRIFLAVAPAFDELGNGVMRGLLEAGALAVLDSSGDDDSALAAAANRYEADLFFGLRPGAEPGCHCSYWESGQFRSEAGFRVAKSVSDELGATLAGAPVELCGRRHTALRETSMAAVLCEPVAADDAEGTRFLVTASEGVARALVIGIRRGIEEPVEADEGDEANG
jgi:N-acetylmuramoyl-L-alanine amidase